MNAELRRISRRERLTLGNQTTPLESLPKPTMRKARSTPKRQKVSRSPKVVRPIEKMTRRLPLHTR